VIRRTATFLGALVMMVGVPAGTLFVLGRLQASPGGYLAGIALGLLVMCALMVALQRLSPDDFVLEVAIVCAFAAGLAFVAWLALRDR
jgi:hypothetical protein